MEDTKRTEVEKVQTFGRKKNAVAVALVKSGSGQFRLNGMPIETIRPEVLRIKVYEPLLLMQGWQKLDFRLRVKGGGYTSQIYAMRQAVARGILAHTQKYVDEATKREQKDTLAKYDRTLVVADPRRCEPKKFGGRGAPARFQKSYR